MSTTHVSATTPRRPRSTSPVPRGVAQRQGLCHVSVVVRKLLALYGIEEYEEPLAAERPQPATRSVPPVRLSQQLFPFVAPVETNA